MAPGRHPPAVQPQDSTVARSESPRPPSRGAHARRGTAGWPLERWIKLRTGIQRGGTLAVATQHDLSPAHSMSVRLDLAVSRLTPVLSIDALRAVERNHAQRAADGPRGHRCGGHRRGDARAAAGAGRRARRARQQRRRRVRLRAPAARARFRCRRRHRRRPVEAAPRRGRRVDGIAVVGRTARGRATGRSRRR